MVGAKDLPGNPGLGPWGCILMAPSGRPGRARSWCSAVLGLVSFVFPTVIGCVPDRIAVSPNNNDIVMTLKRDGSGAIRLLGISGEASPGMELYLYQLKQGRLLRLTRNDVCDICPDFSPDGKRLVYCSGDTREFKNGLIKVMRLEDKSTRLIAQGFCPDWSPRTEHIAFLFNKVTKVADKVKKSFQLRIVQADGSDERLVYESGKPPVFCWDSSGGRLYYAHQADGEPRTVVRCLDVGTRAVTDIIQLEHPLWEADIGFTRLVCSPDSTHLALELPVGGASRVAVINTEQKAVEYLDRDKEWAEVYVRDPKFSPSGILSTSCGYDPSFIVLYQLRSGTWQRIRTIPALGSEAEAGALYWGNYAWLVVDGKEKMLAGYGQTDSERDFLELRLIDAGSGKVEQNLTGRVRAAFLKAHRPTGPDDTEKDVN